MGQERRAILIGSSQFPADLRLTPLRCPENDVEGLSKLLCSEAQGGYREVVPLKNRPHYEVLKNVNVALKQAKKDDFVLIYYSGHGKLDRAGRLYLAASNTELEALESTSIPVATILDYIRLSNCRSVGLILDCCYSGAVAGSIFRGGVEEQLQLASSSGGIYILTASTGVQVAEEKEKDEYGLLTKYIVQGIESGEADLTGDGRISMDELYEYVHGKVRQEGFQEPMKWDLNVTGELIIAWSGKSPREERCKQVRQMMLDYAREGQISDRLLAHALEVLKLRPDELHGETRKRDELLHQLFDERLPLGEFVDIWNVPALGGSDVPPPPPPPHPPHPPPPPWRRRHFRTIATVSVPLVALVAWLVVSPSSKKPTQPPPVEQTTPPAAKRAKKAEKEPARNVLLNPSSLRERSPETFKALFETSKGNFTVQVTRSWAPRGADRFYNLVKNGFYDEARFFRVVPKFVVQFGLPADPNVGRVWSNATFQNDPVKQSNKRGYLFFAPAGQTTPTTQLAINLIDNAILDSQGFAPFGEVVEGMGVVESLYSGYGGTLDQDAITSQGNAYLRRKFPNLDYIKSATVQ